jgi:hypothetical protein
MLQLVVLHYLVSTADLECCGKVCIAQAVKLIECATDIRERTCNRPPFVLKHINEPFVAHRTIASRRGVSNTTPPKLSMNTSSPRRTRSVRCLYSPNRKLNSAFACSSVLYGPLKYANCLQSDCRGSTSETDPSRALRIQDGQGIRGRSKFNLLGTLQRVPLQVCLFALDHEQIGLGSGNAFWPFRRIDGICIV